MSCRLSFIAPDPAPTYSRLDRLDGLTDEPYRSPITIRPLPTVDHTPVAWNRNPLVWMVLGSTTGMVCVIALLVVRWLGL